MQLSGKKCEYICPPLTRLLCLPEVFIQTGAILLGTKTGLRLLLNVYLAWSSIHGHFHSDRECVLNSLLNLCKILACLKLLGHIMGKVRHPIRVHYASFSRRWTFSLQGNFAWRGIWQLTKTFSGAKSLCRKYVGVGELYHVGINSESTLGKITSNLFSTSWESLHYHSHHPNKQFHIKNVCDVHRINF